MISVTYFGMFILLIFSMEVHSAEKIITSEMEDVQFLREELDIISLSEEKNRAIFFERFNKKQYFSASHYLQYLSSEDQEIFKKALLKEALAKNDLDLLNALNEYDSCLLNIEDAAILNRRENHKIRKCSTGNFIERFATEFNIPEIITKRDATEKIELKLYEAVKKLPADKKLDAAKYIVELGTAELLVPFCKDISINRMEILNHACLKGRCKAVDVILQNTTHLLDIGTGEGFGCDIVKLVRYKKLKPLFTAYRKGYSEIVKALIKRYPCLLLYSCDNDISHTIFYEAMIRQDYHSISEWLPYYPANSKFKKDYSVLQVAAFHSDIKLAEMVLFEDFVSQQIDFFQIGCTTHESPWVLAANNQDISMIRLFIKIYELHKKDKKKGQLSISGIVKSIGVAISKRNLQIVKLLYGKFPQVKNEIIILSGDFNRDIIEFALTNNLVCYDKNGVHFIIEALLKGYYDIINNLIREQYDFGLARSKNGETFFLRACFIGDMDIIKHVSQFCNVEDELGILTGNFKNYIENGNSQRPILAILKHLIDLAIQQNVSISFYLQIITFISKTPSISDEEVFEIINFVLGVHPETLTLLRGIGLYHLCTMRFEITQILREQLSTAIVQDDMLLHNMCKGGSLASVQWILQIKPTLIENVDTGGNTVLHYACKSNHADALEIIDYINKRDPELVKRRNNQGRTVLHAIIDEMASSGEKKYTSQDIPEVLAKIACLLKYDENILEEKCNILHFPINHYVKGFSFLPDFLYELLELYRSKNITITRPNIRNFCRIKQLSTFLDYLALANKPNLSFAELDGLFHISNSYDLYADELTLLGLQYDIPELIEGTDLFRSKTLQNDLWFLFNNVPNEIGLTSKTTKKKLVGAVLLAMFKKLKIQVIDFFSKRNDDISSKVVCEWIGQTKILRKGKSRIQLLFAPAQVSNLIIDQINKSYDITRLLGQVAQFFNLQILVDKDNNTLLHYALRNHNGGVIILLCTMNRKLMQQTNKQGIAPLDLLPESPFVLHELVKVAPSALI